MGRAHRALPGVGHGHRRVMIAEQGEQVESAQDPRCLPRRGVRPLRREELGDVRMGEGGARRYRRGQGHRAGCKRHRVGRCRFGRGGAGIKGQEEQEASRSFLGQNGKTPRGLSLLRYCFFALTDLREFTYGVLLLLAKKIR